MSFENRLEGISRRVAYLEAALAEGTGDIAALGREYAELRPVADRIGEVRRLRGELAEARALTDEPEMRALAEDEAARLSAELAEAEDALRRALIPRDAADSRSAIIEIRPGTGGEEAALFAADLARMYQRHAEAMGWTVTVIEAAPSEMGGLRDFVAQISGQGVFARLRYESGVHRVQRVPATESGGRIHTSAVTIAVLPEAEEVEVEIDPADIRVDTMRASGAGGQHVNTTDSAVRITHIPTGMVVSSSEKSQHQNRARAMEVLRARLFDAERRRAGDARAADRRAQVGSGDRSERIRTYNFPQGRVTDHRINLTLHRLGQVMDGDLSEITEALIAEDEARKLAEMEP